MPLFSSFALKPDLLKVLEEIGFQEATPIQAASIPLLLEGRDLVGQSKTGSGKTLAFSLPILNQLDLSRREVQALVLCPTRELCTQVARELRRLGRKFPSLGVVTLVGGQPTHPQVATLRRGAHIAVGTPGRVLDHLRRQSLDLRAVEFLVLDEADRMLDMGFQEEMEAILAEIPEQRQTVFFSATFPETIEEMSAAYQHQPARVEIEQAPNETRNIEQRIYEVHQEDKALALIAALAEVKPASAIVFCNLKATVAELDATLKEAGVSSACLHGDMIQEARDRVMAKFRNGSVRLLVATDVAARGIDVADLDLVVNFDLPKPEIYVHRIGRTGRAGKSGLAISLMTPKEKYKIGEIEALLETQLTVEPAPAAAATEAAEAASSEAAMATLYIGGGRKEKVRPGDILGALTGEAAGLQGADVGKIEIHDHFAYVAVSRSVAEVALERLRNGKIKGRKFRVELVR